MSGKESDGDKGNVLDTGLHLVDTPLEHPDGELDLTHRVRGILPARNHIKGGLSLNVKAKEYLLASHSLRKTSELCRVNRPEPSDRPLALHSLHGSCRKGRTPGAT